MHAAKSSDFFARKNLTEIFAVFNVRVAEMWNSKINHKIFRRLKTEDVGSYVCVRNTNHYDNVRNTEHLKT